MGNKSELEKKAEQGAFGQPELKKHEKNEYLGEYEERVIKYLTYDQVLEPGTYPEILEAIKEPAAKKLIIDREVELQAAQDYIELARENNLNFTRVDSPDFKGDIALVIVSDQAVNTENRKVLSRKERLKDKGISDKIIKNVGAHLCNKCWEDLTEKAPEELINYKKMSWLDKLSGEKCLCE